METAVTDPADVELHLLTEWRDPDRWSRARIATVVTLVLHAAAIAFVLIMPETFMQPAFRAAAEPLITPLVLPPLTVTQKEPNKEKLIREFRSADLTPRVKSPAAPSPEPQAPAPRKAAPAPPPSPRGAPQTPLPEPPKVEIAASEPPKLSLPVQPPQVAQPASPFEDVQPLSQSGAGAHGALPGPSVGDVIRGNLHGSGANIEGMAPVASTGAELPQLLSDPRGVDFRPYLAHVLAAVRQYWLTTLPSSVKAGRRGFVSVEFAILRDGTVRKASFIQQTGDMSLDNAAVAAISGGGPFGALPSQYPGAEIRVVMNFSYNVPKR